MTTTAEEFEREAVELMQRHIDAFHAWSAAYLADVTAYSARLDASDVSQSFKIAIAKRMNDMADQLAEES